MGYTESLVWCEVAYLVITNYPLQLPLTQGELEGVVGKLKTKSWKSKSVGL
jgi:hypothetical protein